MGRPMVLFYFSVAFIVVQTTLCFALIPRLGITGAAIASTSTYIFGAIVRTAYFRSVTGLSPTKLWIAHAEDLSTFKNALEGLIRR
jgi:O-antigen/teichoic acid export membrane protein